MTYSIPNVSIIWLPEDKYRYIDSYDVKAASSSTRKCVGNVPPVLEYVCSGRGRGVFSDTDIYDSFIYYLSEDTNKY